MQDNKTEERGLDSAIVKATEALGGHGLRLPIDFTFRWRGRAAVASVIGSEEGVVLRLRLELGAVPYTAEDPPVRTRINYVMSRQAELPLGRFGIDARQMAVYTADISVDEPLSSTGIVTALVRSLLRVSPYLDLAQPR